MAGPVLYSDLALRAPQYAPEIAAWTILRAVDEYGQGRVSGKAVREALAGLGWNRAKIRRVLHRGDPVFWTQLADGAIHYRSVVKVFQNLCIATARDAEIVSPKDLTGSIGDLRARLAMWGVRKIRKERPTPNAAMADMLGGISTRTVRNYKVRSRVPRDHCFVKESRYTWELWDAYNGPQYRVIVLDGTKQIVRQIGDVLRCSLEKKKTRSRLRRLNRALRPSSGQRGGGSRSGARSRAQRAKGSPPPKYTFIGRIRKSSSPGAGDVLLFTTAVPRSKAA